MSRDMKKNLRSGVVSLLCSPESLLDSISCHYLGENFNSYVSKAGRLYRYFSPTVIVNNRLREVFLKVLYKKLYILWFQRFLQFNVNRNFDEHIRVSSFWDSSGEGKATSRLGESSPPGWRYFIVLNCHDLIYIGF